MSKLIYHIAEASSVEEAARSGSYRHDSLDTEGFIHCSTADQLLVPANERFRGQRGLVLLAIPVDSVAEHLVFEDSYGTGIEFPHIYSPVPWSVVIDVIPFPCREDGYFDLPSALSVD